MPRASSTYHPYAYQQTVLWEFTTQVILLPFLAKAVRYLWTSFRWERTVNIRVPTDAHVKLGDMSSSRKTLTSTRRAA